MLSGATEVADPTACISSLPLELLDCILWELRDDPKEMKKLAGYARVCRYWAEAFMPKVYERIVLQSPQQARKLADNPGGLQRHSTKTLVLDSMSASIDSRTICSILRHCTGLRELVLGDFQEKWRRLLGHPSVKELESLTFHRAASRDVDNYKFDNQIPHIPFRLRRLKASLFDESGSDSQEELLEVIGEASLCGAGPTLTELEVRVFGSLESLVPLLNVATHLTCFKLSEFHIRPTNQVITLTDSLYYLLTFLSSATSLREFNFSPNSICAPTLISHSLPLLFESLRSPLSILALSIPSRCLSEAAFVALVECLDGSASLSRLLELKLWDETWKTVEKYSQWDIFLTLLSKRRVKLARLAGKAV